MEYDLAEHRHRFAAWAAARAAQRGFGASVAVLRNALQATDIREKAADCQALQTSPEEFNVLHKAWCRAICTHLQNAGVKNVTYGRAVKLVAVYLKTIVIMGPDCDSPFGETLHPPIDRVLLTNLATLPTSPVRGEAWLRKNWTQLDETAYYDLVEKLRTVLPVGTPFWMLEEYWDPSAGEE